MRRSLSKFLKRQRELLAPKQSGFVRFSGVTIPKKKPHGNKRMIYEKTTQTYLLAILNLGDKIHLKVGRFVTSQIFIIEFLLCIMSSCKTFQFS
jgi:hypothetical protein